MLLPHPPSILLVDDQPRNVVALEAALASVDCSLVTANSGRDALKRLLTQDFALIVLDVHMPGMDGFETASLIRARERSRLTPIIFLTADNPAGARVLEAYRLGAVDYLYKPFDPNILRSKVSFFVELFRKAAALEQRTTELTQVTADLVRREQQVVALNAELEGRVLERTAALEAAIGDLEAEAVERLRIEETLRASEERFRKQYKGFPLPTYSWLQVGDDFVLQDFNDAAEASAEGRILSGRLASERLADEPSALADLQACVAEQRTLRRQMRYRSERTGLERELAVTYVFVPPRTVMIHTEDVTEARQAEQQREAMAQSEKLRALGQMATGIAHDLNQSLMLVASYSDLARQALAEDPPNLVELGDLLTTTTQAALDGGVTVKRLLLFTRAAPEHDSQLVDLSKVVHDAAQLTAPRWRDTAQAGGRPISLHIEAEEPSIIQGSPAQLRELLTNVIFNAVDALPTGGTIGLRVASEDGQAIVEVADSGVGMSAEVKERVFEPFFTTKGESGTGLGLAMVFRIVEQHGGQIDVRSAPGAGTTFRITLPLANAPAEPAPTPPAQLEPPRPLRVLVVDDEPMMTRAVMRMLKPAGHAVSVAGSGEEALERLAEQTFDVVVSDMGMGLGMNGWDLADAVNRRWSSVRFLLATGWGAAIDPAEARARGVEAVLAKPYHPADLLRALARIDDAALDAHLGGADHQANELVGGGRGGLALAHQSPAAHHEQAVSDLEHVLHIVGDDEHRHTLVPKRAHEL